MDVGCPKLSFPPNLLLEVSCSGSGVPLPLKVGYPLWQSAQAGVAAAVAQGCQLKDSVGRRGRKNVFVISPEHGCSRFILN